MELNIKSLDEKLKDNIIRFNENLSVFDKINQENMRIKKDLIDSYNKFFDLSDQLNKMVINIEEQQKSFADEVNTKHAKFENKIIDQIKSHSSDTRKKIADIKNSLDEEIKNFNENIEMLKLKNNEEFEKFNLNIDSVKEMILDINKKYDEKLNKVHIAMEIMDKELKRINDNIKELNKKLIEQEIVSKNIQIKSNKNFRNGLIISSLVTVAAVIIIYFLK